MSEPAGVAVRRRTLIESGLAVIAALVAAVVPHNPLRAWSSTPQAPYAALVACGLLTSAAVVGGLWGDRPFVRLMRRSLVVMALVALVIGTGILTVGWSLLGTQHTGRPYGPGSWLGAYTTVRSFTMVFIWPPTVFIAWVLGSMALLVGKTIRCDGRFFGICIRGARDHRCDRRGTGIHIPSPADQPPDSPSMARRPLVCGCRRRGDLPSLEPAVQPRLRSAGDAGPNLVQAAQQNGVYPGDRRRMVRTRVRPPAWPRSDRT